MSLESHASPTRDARESPYRRDNYFGHTDEDETDDPRPPGRDWGRHHRFKTTTDPNEIIAHRILSGSAKKLCATTLFDAPYNGGRMAELFAWLLEDEPIDGREGALHHENREVELSEPELHLPRQGGREFGTREYGQYRHRRRVNQETGYISGGESTAVVIPDRPTPEFMDLVGWYLNEVRSDLPPKLRREGKALAKQLKSEGETRDVDIMTRVLEHVRHN